MIRGINQEIHIINKGDHNIASFSEDDVGLIVFNSLVDKCIFILIINANDNNNNIINHVAIITKIEILMLAKWYIDIHKVVPIPKPGKPINMHRLIKHKASIWLLLYDVYLVLIIKGNREVKIKHIKLFKNKAVAIIDSLSSLIINNKNILNEV